MKIKLISLNCWFLPYPLSRENDLRVKKLINLIERVDPDIVALQEVWMKGQIKKLSKALSKYNQIFSESMVYNKTGLFTATKIVPQRCIVGRFPPNYNLNFIELAASKGYQQISYGEFVLINTHLYSPFMEGGKRIVRNQIGFLCEVARKNVKPVVVLGDLNIGINDLNNLSGGMFEVVKNGGINTRSRENPYANINFNKLGKTYDITDHVLVFNSDGKLRVKQRVIKDPLISDHYVLEVEIEIKSFCS